MTVSSGKRWVLLAAIGGTVAALAVPGQAAPTVHGWAKPVLVSKTQAHRETSLAINPRDNRQQMICDPSGVPNTDGGQSYFHRTTDGGKTWHYQDVEGGTTDTRNYAFEGGDCDVAFDAGGTAYAADTWLGDLSVGHSTDGGKTWDGTALSGTSPVIDRPWLVGGPKGTVYLSYHDLQCCSPAAMWFTKSTDYGKTFSPAVPITTANADGAFIWEGNFVVSPSGKDIDLIYSRRSSINGISAGAGGESPMSLWLASSRDGGSSWTSTKVTNLSAETTTIYPQIGRDAGGYLHVVWCQPGAAGTPVWYTYSKDGGRSWRGTSVLNPKRTGWAPWVVGGKTKGSAAVVWLGSPDAKATQSTDSPWFFDWARVSIGSSGKPLIRTGSTTKQPIWQGRQTYPEFEMVTLDAKGLMHIGMSVYQGPTPTKGQWSVWSQVETSTSH
jgi:hypothetical protein